MNYLQSHWTSILTVWGVVWALATALQSTFPTASVAARICHAILAVSPLDFVKASKQLGAALVPPVAALALFLAVNASACSLFGSSTPAASPDPKAQQTAQAAVSTVAEAWNLAAESCMALAGATDAGAANPALAHACAKTLFPIHDVIVEAQVAVSVWDAASQSNLPCLMHAAADGLTTASSLFHVPQAVHDAALVAESFSHACSDGGH